MSKLMGGQTLLNASLYKCRSSKCSGFTLVELIVAMAFFSFMMAIISIGFIQITHIYQAGVSSRRTQEAGRSIMEDIAREVRSASAIDSSSGIGVLCLTGGQ